MLLEQNSLHASTTQIDKNQLDEDYLNIFQEKITNFLKSQIDVQKQQEELESRTPLEIERAEQLYFAQTKRKNFIGQESSLAVIEDYISNDNHPR